MREIKFRVWDKDEKIFLTNTECDFFTLNDMKYDDPNLFMQFTGLKDKNGKEIFEGDILRKTIELEGGFVDNWIVFYGEAGFDIKNIDTSSEVKTMYLKKYWKHNYEVIGNIHENPELL